MKQLDARTAKRFNSLLINTKMCYWGVGYEPTDYIGRVDEALSWYTTRTREKKMLEEVRVIIVKHELSNQEIEQWIRTMDNPCEAWRKRMRDHNRGGYETRDNKGQFVELTTVYAGPRRYPNGNIEMCRFNKIRYPKKARSKRTWKKFYEMFPAQAVIDGWDGNTSDRMR